MINENTIPFAPSVYKYVPIYVHLKAGFVLVCVYIYLYIYIRSSQASSIIFSAMVLKGLSVKLIAPTSHNLCSTYHIFPYFGSALRLSYLLVLVLALTWTGSTSESPSGVL